MKNTYKKLFLLALGVFGVGSYLSHESFHQQNLISSVLETENPEGSLDHLAMGESCPYAQNYITTLKEQSLGSEVFNSGCSGIF